MKLAHLMFSFVLFLQEVLKPILYVFIIFFVQNLASPIFFFGSTQFFFFSLIITVSIFILIFFYSILRASTLIFAVLTIFQLFIVKPFVIIQAYVVLTMLYFFISVFFITVAFVTDLNFSYFPSLLLKHFHKIIFPLLAYWNQELSFHFYRIQAFIYFRGDTSEQQPTMHQHFSLSYLPLLKEQ